MSRPHINNIANGLQESAVNSSIDVSNGMVSLAFLKIEDLNNRRTADDDDDERRYHIALSMLRHRHASACPLGPCPSLCCQEEGSCAAVAALSYYQLCGVVATLPAPEAAFCQSMTAAAAASVEAAAAAAAAADATVAGVIAAAVAVAASAEAVAEGPSQQAEAAVVLGTARAPLWVAAESSASLAASWTLPLATAAAAAARRGVAGAACKAGAV